MDLTTKEALMVIEYFAQQAAEDMPDGTATDFERHMWQSLLTVSLAVGRRITEQDWDTLVSAQMELQSFDRDPAGYLHEEGHENPDDLAVQDDLHQHLETQVAWAIDNCLANSGA
jgi:hypothetical protein